ncbi:MAG: TRAP transporter substrate-binding protein DctP [Spirochaetaceae bacterium]|jgi:C4-dicarboxylate-binding protein DctP|nr:TRAP transporter substrate-binding protein DctP [Spirochaetaceae bacterium]
MKCLRVPLLACAAVLALAACSLPERLGELLPGARRESLALKPDSRTDETRHIIRLAFHGGASWPRQSRSLLPAHAGALTFKGCLETLTGGAVAVALYPEGTLGTPAETLALVCAGGIEGAFTSGAAGALYPPLQLINLPHAFDSPEALWDFFDNSELWRELCGDFADATGLVVLGAAQNGTLNFSNSRLPVTSPADLRGLKIAVPDTPIHGVLVEALGGRPLVMPPGERREALVKGDADGTQGVLWDMDARRWYTAQKYLTLDSHAYAESLLVMNGALLAALPEEYRRAVRQAAREAEQMARLTETLLSRSLDYPVMDTFLEVHRLTQAERGAFREALRPVYDWLRGEIGGELVDRFMEDTKARR